MVKALVLIDLQNDFMPWGSLPVPKADELITLANALQDHFDVVVATQDWHPADHASFAANHPDRNVGDVIDLEGLRQELWPAHCVQHSDGASLVKGLDVSRAHIARKGSDKMIDSYSAFSDNGHRKDTGLHGYLQSKKVDTIYVLGVATDYCVKFTALDGRRLGYDVYLIEDACRGIDLKPGDIDHALDEMHRAGVKIIKSMEI